MPALEPPPAPAKTEPSAPPDVATEKAPVEFMADAMADFAEMDAGKPAPSIARDDKGKFAKSADKPAAKADAEKPKPVEKPVEPVEQPEEKAAEKSEEKPAEPVKPVKAAELRNAYEGLKKKVQTELEPEIQRLKSKVHEYEQRSPEDSAPLLEKVKNLEQRNAQLEQHMAFVDYTQSNDFVTKYQEPYKQAWNDAVSEFRELTVREKSGEDEVGEPVIKMRPADENDLLRLANMKLSDMDAAATEMFGASAARAIGHIQNIKRLSSAQHKAIQDAKTKAGEWRTQQTAEFQNRAKNLGDIWINVNKALEEKFPKAYKPEEGDAEDTASHTKGFALADLLFLGPEGLTPEQTEALPSSFKDTLKAKKPLTEAQKVQLHALARLKMANHDRKVVALKKAQERIKELEKTIEEFEKSEPSGKATERAPGDTTSKDWLQQAEDELRALDK